MPHDIKKIKINEHHLLVLKVLMTKPLMLWPYAVLWKCDVRSRRSVKVNNSLTHLYDRDHKSFTAPNPGYRPLFI